MASKQSEADPGPGYVRVFADEGAPMSALLSRLVAARKADHAVARGVPLGCLARLLRAFGEPPTAAGARQDAAAAVPGLVEQLTVDVAFPLGAFVCLAIARGWARGRLAPAAAALVWFGCALLLLRGGAGILDDLTHATGLLPNGLTGLSTKETTGTAALRWSGWAIDAYFLAGGIIFGFRPAPARIFGGSIQSSAPAMITVGTVSRMRRYRLRPRMSAALLSES